MKCCNRLFLILSRWSRIIDNKIVLGKIHFVLTPYFVCLWESAFKIFIEMLRWFWKTVYTIYHYKLYELFTRCSTMSTENWGCPFQKEEKSKVFLLGHSLCKYLNYIWHHTQYKDSTYSMIVVVTSMRKQRKQGE